MHDLGILNSIVGADMWDTFIATLSANILAVVIVGLPVLAIWAFLSDRGRQTWQSIARSSRALSLKVRFGWLVLNGKRSRNEFESWFRAERLRTYILNLVSEGPKARSHAKAQFLGSLRKVSSDSIEAVYSRPARDALLEAADHMSVEEFMEPWEMSPMPDRVDWIMSRPLLELAKWAFRLSRDDREKWKSWLMCPNTVAEFEQHHQKSGKEN